MTALPVSKSPLEATVCQSKGSLSVSFSTATFTVRSGNRSRSAAIWATTVAVPWPISVRATLTITDPSEFILMTAAVEVKLGMAGALCSVATPLPILRPVRAWRSSSSGVSRP